MLLSKLLLIQYQIKEEQRMGGSIREKGVIIC